MQRADVVSERRLRHMHRAALLDKVEALQRADARLFGSILANVGPIAQWPLQTLAQMLSAHLTYQPRMSLTLFVLGNQCPADLYADWLISRGMLRDMPARLHVANLVKQHKAGQLARFTTYMLPFRVTAPPKPVAERKHPWDGVGDPMPADAPSSAFIFPVETPQITDTDGWRWDQAYATLMQARVGILPTSISLPEISIVPTVDPDDLSDDEFGNVRVDAYGMPLDTYMVESMDMQVTLHNSACKRPSLTDAALATSSPEKKPRGVSDLF